jgi:hypothetical protein
MPSFARGAASSDGAVLAHDTGVALRARVWRENLERLGLELPSFVVHDVGVVLSIDTELWRLTEIEPGNGERGPDHGAAYVRLIREVAEHPVAAELRALRLSDALVPVVLARLLSKVAGRSEDVHRSRQSLVESQLYLLTLLETLDLGTLALCGALGEGQARALESVDALFALGSAEAHDVAEFSLQILPSVLETKARPSASPHRGDGYAGLSKQGGIDNLLPSELAWDDEELIRRLSNDELLYYSHEQAREDTRRQHHLLIDASASMRGSRAVFARGMAIASAKKLVLAGELVSLRFFDSRLYEPHVVRAGQLPLAYLLAFRSERGRNPARVFRELGQLLERETSDRREHLVTVYTHAALHVPRDLVARVAQKARLAAVFMLPRSEQLYLDYLDLLQQHWVVDDRALGDPRARKQAALGILHGP